jgi:hypothetical protein
MIYGNFYTNTLYSTIYTLLSIIYNLYSILYNLYSNSPGLVTTDVHLGIFQIKRDEERFTVCG